MRAYGLRFTQHVLAGFNIDLGKKTRPIGSIPSFIFLRKLDIEDGISTIFKAQKWIDDLKFYCDRHKQDNVRTEEEVVWKKDSIGEE